MTDAAAAQLAAAIADCLEPLAPGQKRNAARYRK
jgi:hypothetical protein